MTTQAIQKQDITKQIKVLEGDLAFQQQEDRIRSLMIKEVEEKKLRKEWRKSLENGYEVQMKDQKKKITEEMKHARTGPTTMQELGSHYQHQIAKQKLAEEKMQARAEAVADIIQAPTRIDNT